MAPDETTIYYVFSTIAQTLAGIVGILAAFAVMRLSDFSRRLEKELPSLGDYCQYPEVFYSCVADGDFEGALTQVSEDAVSGLDIDLTFSVCRRAERERKRLVSALQLSIWVTCIVVAFSVGNLIFAKWLAANGALTWTVFIIGFIGLASCLTSAGVLVTRLGTGITIRRGKEDGFRNN